MVVVAASWLERELNAGGLSCTVVGEIERLGAPHSDFTSFANSK